VAFPGENLAGLQNSFCSFAISFALLSNSARSFGFYFFFPCNCLLPAFFWVSLFFRVLSLLFLLFKYAAVFSMTTTLTTATASEGPERALFFPSFPGQVQQTFPTADISFAFHVRPATFLRRPHPLSLSLFVSGPLSQTLPGICVCLLPCLPAAFACFYGIN